MSSWQETFPWTAAFLRFLWPAGPARRKRWTRFALALVILIAAHAGLTMLVAARTAEVVDGFVARFGPLKPERHAPPSVDDAANKARAVRAAAEVMTLPPARIGGAWLHESFGTWTDKHLGPADSDFIRKVVEENAIALSLLDLAAARSGSSWGLHYERGLEMDIPPLMRIIQLAKLNAAAGRLALEDGRIDDALTAVRRGSAIASSLESEPVVIVQIVRLAIDRINRTLARGMLATADLGPGQLATLRAALSAGQPRRALQQAWIVEAKALDEIVRGAPVDSLDRTTGRRTDGVLDSGVVRVIARPFSLNEERIWLQLMTRRIDALEAPRHARDAGTGPEIRSWNVLVRTVGGGDDPSGLVERVDLAEAGALLADVAFAVELRRVETGRAPATLAELVPAYLPAVPVDPLTGRAFLYETDGAAWRVRSEFDWSAMESARLHEPPLDWSRAIPASLSPVGCLPTPPGRGPGPGAAAPAPCATRA